MNAGLTIALLSIGMVFTFLAAIGILRMPDVFMRMQVATKAATLGVTCVALAAAIHFGDLATWARAVSIVLFLFLTAPVAAHAIGRAAHVAGARLWEGTIVDELREQYERRERRPDTQPERHRTPPHEDRKPVGTR